MRNSSVLSKTLSLGIVGFFFLIFQACVHAPPVRKKACRAPAVYKEALSGLSSAYHSLSGTVKVRVETDKDKFSFTGDLYARAPDKLHFDIFGFLHRPRFILIKRGGTIAWKDFESGRTYTGPIEACPGFPARFPFSPLFLKDLMRILFLDFPGPLALRIPEEPKGPCRFLMTCRWGRFDVTIDPGVGLPVRIEGPKGGKTPFTLTFGDYGEISGLVVPRRYGITVGDVEMTFDFKTLQVNPAIPPEVFVPDLSR